MFRLLALPSRNSSGIAIMAVCNRCQEGQSCSWRIKAVNGNAFPAGKSQCREMSPPAVRTAKRKTQVF
jgi:hypothetical protein